VASKCEFSKIDIPNDPEYAAAAGKYVVEIAKMIGFDEQAVQAIELGVREAIKAAIAYSFESGERATLELTCERIGEGMKVVVKDKGLPFADTMIAFESDETETGTFSPLGRQVFRLKEFMDEVVLHNLGHEGKEIVLIKYLKSKTITDYYAECELEPYELPLPEIAPDPAAGECTVRRMKPSEAAEVSKSVYKTYG